MPNQLVPSWKVRASREINDYAEICFAVDEQWAVSAWNKAAELNFRINAEQAMGQSLWGTFPSLSSDTIIECARESAGSGQPRHLQLKISDKWFDCLLHTSGDRLNFRLKDITPQKRAEAQVTKLNEVYHHVFKATSDAIWHWNLADDYVFRHGEHFKKQFGYDIVDAVFPTSLWMEVVHHEDCKRVMDRLHKILADPKQTHWSDQYRYKKADGTYAYVIDTGHIIRQNGKAVTMIGALRDISESEHAKQQLLESLTEQQRLQEQVLNQEITKQQEITRAIINTQEQERMEIAKELHDNINQILTTIKLYLEIAISDETNRLSLLQKSYKYSASVIKEIRSLCRNIIAPTHDEPCLINNVQELISSYNVIERFAVHFTPPKNFSSLKPEIGLTMFRILQEALNNVVKYANAKNVWISLQKGDGIVRLVIKDDGAGFDPNAKGKGVGLINIHNRVSLYQGKVTIVSSPGKGCVVDVELPLSAKGLSVAA